MIRLLPLLLLLGGCAVPHRSSLAKHSLANFAGRPDGMISLEMWSDKESGGGWFLLADPDVQAFHVVHTNQTAIGGGSVVAMGRGTISVDPQASAIISATGTAVGNVVGAAVKTAAGKP